MTGLTAKLDEAVVLLSNFNAKSSDIALQLTNLPWKNKRLVEIFDLDNENNLSLVKRWVHDGKMIALPEEMPTPSVKVIRITPKAF